MGLSWNRQFRQAMASCSADTTVKIWDVTTQACSHTFTHHTDKVQSVLWNDESPTVLASGSFDKTVALMDCRTGTVTPCIAKLSSDIESLAWDPFNSHHLYASLENGEVACIDIRMNGKSGSKAAIKGLQGVFPAHEETTTAITFSSQVRGLCATSSVDKTVKIWDTEPICKGKEPVLVAYKSMSVGQLFACQFFKDEPFMLGTGGDAGMLAIWDSDEQQGIKDYFADRVELKPSDYLGVTQAGDVEMTEGDGVGSGSELLAGLTAVEDRRREEAAMQEEALLQELGGSVATSNSAVKDTKKKNKKKSKVKKTN
jgi:periodic tryptophan protein 1